jgi:hypothetical protein
MLDALGMYRAADYFGLSTRPQNVTIDDRRFSGTARFTF